MFSKTAQYYDKIYAFKDYAAEVDRLVVLVGQYLCSDRRRLLDVACGTGLHIQHLSKHFRVEGLDIDPGLLEIAQARNPGILFHHGNMMDFHLDSTFDVITCLFSSIGYVCTLENLNRTVACMARHLLPAGLLLVEPWFTPDEWKPNTVHGLFIDEADLKIARINTSFRKGRLSFFDLHYLVGTPAGTEHLLERHELGLFTREEMQAAFHRAGLDVTHDAEGLMGRGLYLARKHAN